ncbi:Signal recognition particle, SRP54 subunit, GTPase [Metarhizium album ARSEF 1941]|uniref:Signal recognition particle, SRP54 subunit, GTPase n=1 Tax=Metarhizium album (strain ARSEF 1941) TaxID=1081103 RepID=A0A0B2X7P7_METAS|nr:Signal recognition particle, SRP54 subunit, GTPase [Metarhizium album ARSEF 1941]KHO01540.1 Signal recognition particle, SRP54 subunit, GTPase [Metarhizium album ARSEF 1941]
MSAPQDDKVLLCVPFITRLLQAHHRAACPGRPLFIGLNGMQGVGKTTLAAALAAALQDRGIHTLVFSIDDFYLPHDEQVRLAAGHAGNALVQHRGEPGTHDVALAQSVLASLADNTPTRIPRYDKALFSGQGDLLPASQWIRVNHPGQPPVRVVIFEGWCVGFRALEAAELRERWARPSRTLRNHRLQHLQFVNEQLRSYDALTDFLDAFVHIDSEDAVYVYAWRQEQEDSLRATRGDSTAGMTPEQVVAFVDAYYPAYELYTDGLRRGVFRDRPGRQLRLVVDRDRKVKEIVQI